MTQLAHEPWATEGPTPAADPAEPAGFAQAQAEGLAAARCLGFMLVLSSAVMVTLVLVLVRAVT